MSSPDCSSSISSEDRSDLSSDENSDILDDNGTALVLYDEDLGPIATVKRPPHTRKAWFLKKNGISSSKHILLAK